jgi:hypothetical protein
VNVKQAASKSVAPPAGATPPANAARPASGTEK